jgi:small GTP-binding protein
MSSLDGTLAALRESEIRLLTDIGASLADVGASAQDDRQRLLDVAQDLRDMFYLVVVIGEFNAGKSTFINALLGDTLLPMGITPTTEVIELIRYAETTNHKPEMRSDGIREWAHPNTGASGVALVDTPGVGSVFQKHEKTAKAFLHRSDLVIFVVSAKRAFAETERLYLELAKNYGKKVLLVVNQIDLLQPAEQTEVRRFIETQVDEMLNMRPLLFMVSAKEALNAIKSGSPIIGDPGGMEGLRAHLRGVFAETPPAKQKLVAQLAMAERLLNDCHATVQKNASLVTADTTKVKEVQRELEQQSLGLQSQMKAARAELDTVFDGMRQRGMAFIDQNLSVRKVGRTAKPEVLQAEFQEVVIGRALRDVGEATNGYINAVVDSSRLYWRSVVERLNQLRDLLDQEVTALDAGVYAEQREALQEAIKIAESELKSYSSGQIVTEMQDIFEKNGAGFTTSSLAALSGVVLVILALLPAGPVISTAAPLALPAFIVGAPLILGGGFFAVRYLRRVIRDTKKDLNLRIDELQQSYHKALDGLTQKERTRLTQYGQQVLTPIYSRLDVLAKRYAAQESALRAHQVQLQMLKSGIEKAV